MQFNKYTAYSVVSLTENKNNNEMQKVLELIDKLDGMKNLDSAKKFIIETYGIKDSVQNFPISSTAFLNVNENEIKYSLRVVYNNQEESECVVYSYKK